MKQSLLAKFVGTLLRPFKDAAKEWKGWQSREYDRELDDKKKTDDARFAAKLRGERIVP